MTETTVGRPATLPDDASPDGSSTAESLDALRDSGELCMLQPVRHGGRGMDAQAFVAAIAALSSREGSAGWLAAMVNAGAHLVDLLGTDAGDAAWAGSPDALVVAGCQSDGVLSGAGSLSGRWLGVTAAEHADWLLLATRADHGAAWVLVPRGEARIERVDTGELRAAGVCDVSVSGVPVPADRVFARARLSRRGRGRGGRRGGRSGRRRMAPARRARARAPDGVLRRRGGDRSAVGTRAGGLGGLRHRRRQVAGHRVARSRRDQHIRRRSGAPTGRGPRA